MHFDSFSGTKVQTLTPEEVRALVLSLVDLSFDQASTKVQILTSFTGTKVQILMFSLVLSLVDLSFDQVCL
jgi:hypothetical protein